MIGEEYPDDSENDTDDNTSERGLREDISRVIKIFTTDGITRQHSSARGDDETYCHQQLYYGAVEIYRTYAVTADKVADDNAIDDDSQRSRKRDEYR